MKNGTKKNNIIMGTFGPMREVEDFLPPPGDLTFKTQKKKIVVNLDSRIVNFFKTRAKKMHVSYLDLIQEALRAYKRKVETNT